MVALQQPYARGRGSDQEFKPSTMDSAASLQRTRLTMSLKVPFGRRTRHMFG